MENTLKYLAGSVVSAAVAPAISTGSMTAQANHPIRIAENDWTGQLVTINVAKQVLEEAGFDVEN